MSDKPTYEQLEDSLSKAHDEVEELITLYNAATAIGSNLSYKETLESVAMHVTNALNSAGCEISIWHRDQNKIESLIDYNKFYPNEMNKPGQLYDLRDYPSTVHVLKTGQPLQTQVNDPKADSAEIELMIDQNVLSMLILPLKTEHCTEGLLKIYEDVEPRVYTNREIQLVESLAFQAAVELENAYLYEEAQHEISLRKKTEEMLRKNQEKYIDFYNNAPDFYASIDAKTAEIIDCNQTLCDALGYKKSEITGRVIFDIYTPDSADYAKKNVFPKFQKNGVIQDEEFQLQRKDGSKIDISLNVSAIRDQNGKPIYSRSIFRDITERKRAEAQREKLFQDLQKSLNEVKMLSGLLPICASCKKIRDDKGYWNQIESYISKHSEANFSHGICPECSDKIYGDEDWYIDMKKEENK